MYHAVDFEETFENCAVYVPLYEPERSIGLYRRCIGYVILNDIASRGYKGWSFVA
jgi:hypothetical protein